MSSEPSGDARPAGGRLRGVLAIASGTALGQALLLLAAPIITRHVSPAEYGVFAVLNAVVLPLGTVAALRLDLAVPVPDSEEETDRIVLLGILAVLGVVVLGTPAAWLLRDAVGALTGVPQQHRWLFLLAPLLAALVSLFMVLNQLAIRQRQYRLVARRNLLQGAAVAGIQVLAALAGAGAAGLLVALMLGQLVGVLSLAAGLQTRLRGMGTSAASLREVLIRYRTFPLVMAPSGAVNTLGLQAPLILVASLYGAQVAGWLGMTQRVLTLPVTLLGTAVAQVFVGELGAAKREGSDLFPLFRQTSLRLLLVSVMGVLVLLVAGPSLFTTVLGESWTEAGEYARALAIGVGAQMVAASLSPAIVVLGRPLWQAAWDVARLVLVSGAVVLGFMSGLTPVATLWLLTAATVLSYSLQWELARRAVRRVGA